jgi:hypothetical protein
MTAYVNMHLQASPHVLLDSVFISAFSSPSPLHQSLVACLSWLSAGYIVNVARGSKDNLSPRCVPHPLLLPHALSELVKMTHALVT